MSAIRLSKLLALAAAAGWMLFVARPASATVHNLVSQIDGLQEVPPVATTGFGSATMTLDDVSNQFVLSGSFQNLLGTSTNAHVHGPGAVGVPAGVLFGITFDFGVTSGNISFNGVITAAQTATILAGNTYINIHSQFRTGGEIRGQILPELVPEPASVGLSALCGIALVRWRTRRRL